MFKSKKWILIIVIIILGVVLLGWRLWPRSFSDVIASDGREVTSLACSVSIAGMTDEGIANIDTYSLQSLSPGEEDCEAIMVIMNGTDYRPDYRNLLLWPVTEVQSNASQSVTISIILGNQANGRRSLFLGGDLVSVSKEAGNGFLIFHPTDSNMIDELLRYMQLHGNKM